LCRVERLLGYGLLQTIQDLLAVVGAVHAGQMRMRVYEAELRPRDR
jgi:hypothetical protein